MEKLKTQKLKLFGILVAIFACSLALVSKVRAEEVKNNKIGIHILEAGEIGRAAELVNSNGGDWGYVTVPIQADDRDRVKWQKFMDEARRLHMIPIVRMATYGQGELWMKPTLFTVLDFANFLSDLDWPVKKKYVVIFNEVNRASEWGGEIDPEGYAEILAYAQEEFLRRDGDFIVLPAAMDAAAPSRDGLFLDEYVFLRRMAKARPEVFRRLAAFAAHAYPNPGFAGTPWETHRMSVASYKKELAFLWRFGVARDVPVLITETGWKRGEISEKQVGKFYRQAYEGVWQDKQVVAITPFLLFAGEGDFRTFSFLGQHFEKTPVYEAWEGLAKVRGEPELTSWGGVVAGAASDEDKETHKEIGGKGGESGVRFWERWEDLVGTLRQVLGEDVKL